jgi:hypothetical protein
LLDPKIESLGNLDICPHEETGIAMKKRMDRHIAPKIMALITVSYFCSFLEKTIMQIAINPT